jgi:hypothetical protein
MSKGQLARLFSVLYSEIRACYNKSQDNIKINKEEDFIRKSTNNVHEIVMSVGYWPKKFTRALSYSKSMPWIVIKKALIKF